MCAGLMASSLFSPAGRSAERSEAMRVPSAQLYRLASPSSGATRHLLPAGEKRSIGLSSHDTGSYPFIQEAVHVSRS